MYQACGVKSRDALYDKERSSLYIRRLFVKWKGKDIKELNTAAIRIALRTKDKGAQRKMLHIAQTSQKLLDKPRMAIGIDKSRKAVQQVHSARGCLVENRECDDARCS